MFLVLRTERMFIPSLGLVGLVVLSVNDVGMRASAQESMPVFVGRARGGQTAGIPSFTLECAVYSSVGGVTSNGSILVAGQAAVGTMSNASFTIEAGIVPCLARAPSGPPIPTVSEWGAVVLGLMLLGLGTVVFGKVGRNGLRD